jgi:hypothetical protein
MEQIKWISCTRLLPENGIVVETKIDDGKGCRNEGKLKRNNALWFTPDGETYVYYEPTHWRPITN